MAKARYYLVKTMRQAQAERICNNLEENLLYLNQEMFFLKLNVDEGRVPPCKAKKLYVGLIKEVVKYDKVLKAIAQRYDIETEFSLEDFNQYIHFFKP